jgi:acetoin utilization deacetylase AcuC-like enzyme
MLRIAWNPEYAHTLPEGHRFPMEKYNLLPQQLIHEGTIDTENLFRPRQALEEEVLHIHDKEYLHKLKSLTLDNREVRATGFPLSHELVQRELFITGGTIQAAAFAMQFGVAANVAGGTHHAYRDRGEGFCLLNDIAVGAAFAKKQLGVKKVLVVDLDVHQGNGTAKIFESDPSVFTFSMHGLKNYPHRKEHSDLDIALPDGTGDTEYLKILADTLPRLIDQTEPDLIFFQAGVDVLASDKLGRLALSISGCKERDKIVFSNAFRNKIPIVFTMGGGYSEKINTIIEAHANTYRVAQEIFF